jgi:CheY-like chemotaxis protein
MAQRILLVDDDDGFRHICAKLLSGCGFIVEAAADYHRALEILEDGDALHLLITDVVMPQGVNGFALARMARLRRPHLKTLYMTGYDVPTHEAVGKVLRKPVADDVLLAEIRDALAATA